MANEIQLTIDLRCTNGEYTESFYKKLLIDQTTLGAASGIQTIGTSEENVSFGDLATAGVTAFQNLDADHFIDWGLDDGGTMRAIGRLEPGEAASFRLKPSVSLRMKADTASCKLRYVILND